MGSGTTELPGQKSAGRQGEKTAEDAEDEGAGLRQRALRRLPIGLGLGPRAGGELQAAIEMLLGYLSLQKVAEDRMDPCADLLARLRPLRTGARRGQRQLLAVPGFQRRLPPAFEPPDFIDQSAVATLLR